jgi:hypothetical protein
MIRGDLLTAEGKIAEVKRGVRKKLKIFLVDESIARLGAPKKINGEMRIPVTIALPSKSKNIGNWVAIQSGDSYELKESWGDKSYNDDLFSDKKFKKETTS